MNVLQERAERLLDEPWLDEDRGGVDAAVRRIRTRRRRGAALGIAAFVVVVGGLFVASTRGGDSTSLRVADEMEQVFDRDDVQRVVFLRPTATPDQRAEVEAALAADPAVGQAWFVDQDGALGVFRCRFAASPGMLDTVTAAILPSSFEIEPTHLADLDALADRMRAHPGVMEVTGGPADAAEAVRLTGTTYLTSDPACRAPATPIK